jgi:surface-anchored protein
MRQIRQKRIGWPLGGSPLFAARAAGLLSVALGLVACSGTIDGAAPNGDECSALDRDQTLVMGANSGALTSNQQGRLPLESMASLASLASIGDEVDTLLSASALADERRDTLKELGVAQRYARISELVGATLTAFDALRNAVPRHDGGALRITELDELSRLAAQIPVQVRRIKQALRVAGVDRAAQPGLFQSLDTVKLAAQSLGSLVAEAKAAFGLSALDGRLPAAEQESIIAFSGPLPLGSSWYVFDEGHIDAIDIAYEDDRLELSVHDESVEPSVERDPAKTIFVVKSAAKVQVPDERFAFLGPVGSDVWILPEGQPEAEAAELLWAGISTHEIEAGVFVDDSVEVWFRNLVGPNGLCLFESPQDELTNPNILINSEDGLPDTLTNPVGTHRHANWAFKSPGLYLLRVQARGRLANLPGHPWVSSGNAILKFVVIP